MTRENIFTGLEVLDVASFIAGPAATTILSDFGATVVKVEPPTGDPQRMSSTRPPYPPSSRNYAWQLIGRNKRSIALNLKDPAGREVMKRLVAWADVLVTNYPPNVRKRLGLDYETLAPLNAPDQAGSAGSAAGNSRTALPCRPPRGHAMTMPDAN